MSPALAVLSKVISKLIGLLVHPLYLRFGQYSEYSLLISGNKKYFDGLQKAWVSSRFTFLYSSIPKALSRLVTSPSFQVRKTCQSLSNKLSKCLILSKRMTLNWYHLVLSGNDGFHLPADTSFFRSLSRFVFFSNCYLHAFVWSSILSQVSI